MREACCHGFDAALAVRVQCIGLIRRQLLQRCDLDTIANVTPTNASGSTVVNLQQSALDLIAALDPAQREALTFRLDDEATRTDWGYFPRNFHGLALGAMDAKQQKLAHRLVSHALSLHAYAKVTTIIALDNVLDVIEGRIAPAIRDPGRYFLSIYGDPASPPWAFQFEGHHVSLNFTLGEGGVVSPTPLFLGSNPAEIEHGGAPVIRVCGEEEDAGRELLLSLKAEQRAQAVICEEAPPDFVLMNAARVPERMVTGDAHALAQIRDRFDEMSSDHKEALTLEKARPAGLPASAMTPAQRERLDALIAVNVERLPQDLARIEHAKIEAGGIDMVHFAWAGSERRREGHYYRLHGPSLLVEYDNTQDAAHHIHAVWRDPDGDFGADLLRAHSAQHHG